MDKLLYFHIFGAGKEVLVCCVKEKVLVQEDLVKLDAFLAYYNQNYKLHGSDKEELSHTCQDMKCVRGHIIDVNLINR